MAAVLILVVGVAAVVAALALAASPSIRTVVSHAFECVGSFGGACGGARATAGAVGLPEPATATSDPLAAFDRRASAAGDATGPGTAAWWGNLVDRAAAATGQGTEWLIDHNGMPAVWQSFSKAVVVDYVGSPLHLLLRALVDPAGTVDGLAGGLMHLAAGLWNDFPGTAAALWQRCGRDWVRCGTNVVLNVATPAAIGRLGAIGREGTLLADARGLRCPAGVCREGSCFVAGTPVRTRQGLRPIEAIRPGDEVLAEDEETGELAYEPVTRTSIKHERAIVGMELVDGAGARERLEVTPDHPFWVAGQGFVKAGELDPTNARLSDWEHGVVRIEAMWSAPERTTVYNLEVARVHTFFVGTLGTWVHNGICPPGAEPPPQPSTGPETPPAGGEAGSRPAPGALNPGLANMSYAPIRPELKALAPEGETVGEELSARGGHAVYDANGNHLRMVELEDTLATLAARHGQELFAGVLQKTTGMIMAYLEAAEAHGVDTVDGMLAKIGKNMGGFGADGSIPNDVFLGRIKNTGRVQPEELKRLARNGGTLVELQLFIHAFMDYIWAKHYESIPTAKLQAIVRQAGIPLVVPKSTRWGAKSGVSAIDGRLRGGVFGERPRWKRGEAEASQERKWISEVLRYDDGHGNSLLLRGRIPPAPEAPAGVQGSRLIAKFGSKPDAKGQEELPRTEGLSGISARAGQGGEGMTRDQLGAPRSLGLTKQDITIAFPGVAKSEVLQSEPGVLTGVRGIDSLGGLNEKLRWNQWTRLRGLPRAGGISGTTNDLLEAAIMAGLTKEEMQLYLLAIYSHLEIIGGHTAIEVGTAAMNAGLRYVPGDYRSFLPKPFLDLEDVQKVFNDPRFKDLPGVGKPLDYPEVVAPEVTRR